jgi:hypothetical protein
MSEKIGAGCSHSLSLFDFCKNKRSLVGLNTYV